jgi:predicted aldo/keto reductase-like oxidoreductase
LREDIVQYRELGKTGKKVSVISLGCMRFSDEDNALQVVKRAVELGMNYLETAPDYCWSNSEAWVGKAIKGRRDRVLISTKCHPDRDYDLSKGGGIDTEDKLRALLEQSLTRLEVDKVDFFHVWNISTPEVFEIAVRKGGLLDGIKKAKFEGLIDHIGFTSHDTPENIRRYINTGEFECVTVQYNLLDRTNKDVITYAHQKGLGVIIMGPVGGGLLGGFSGELQRLLPKGAKSTAEIALRFVISHPGVSVALSGMTSVHMVEENAAIASLTEPLSEAERQQVQVTLERYEKLAALYCTGCGYCMPCPNHVNIPENFRYMNLYKVYGLEERAKEMYAVLGQEGSRVKGLKADACLECHDCEGKCPQGIDIPERLKEVIATLRCGRVTSMRERRCNM